MKSVVGAGRPCYCVHVPPAGGEPGVHEASGSEKSRLTMGARSQCPAAASAPVMTLVNH